MSEDTPLLMVSVSGRDKPGITAALTRVMLDHDVEIVDVEQASLQDLLGLTFLLDTSGAARSKDGVIKDLLFEGSRLGLTLHFRLFSESEVRKAGQRRLYVLTFFGGTRALAELSQVLSDEGANIEMISSLTQHNARCIEMMVNVAGAENPGRLKRRVMSRGREINVDLAFQKIESYRKSKRLIFFDMDSTLIDMEVIDEMASRAGVFQEVARITEKAMRGEIDFEEALTQRVALLKGLSVAEMTDIREHLVLSEGVETVAATLKALGFKLGLVTGGFDFFADHLKARLGFDFAYANRLEIKNDTLTGRLIGPIVDAAQKARIVNQVSRELNIMLDQTVAVGDGANDALMLGQAGLGLSYNAKTDLGRVASSSIGRSRMMNVLYLLGITEDDIREISTDRPG
ncbi:MAG: phosphoserine phosphatase SerB [Proteobacteria bacterium]|nr:phosphoserine phosphatase SerB [Pseudomonadota bacterium]